MENWRNFACLWHYVLSSNRDINTQSSVTDSSPPKLCLCSTVRNAQGALIVEFSVNRISEHLGASTVYLILTLVDGRDMMRCADTDRRPLSPDPGNGTLSD